MTRFVFAGAGSIQFAPILLADITNSERLGDFRVVMHDIDADRLDLLVRLAERMLPHAKSDVSLEATTDPRQALPGADFVVISIELERFGLWDIDRELPAHMGVPQALGENGGPGGLFHAMRMIPGAVKLARETEELCPDALVINLTNPLSRICMGILDCSSVNLVGLCHEIHGGRAIVSRLLDVPREELRVEAAGLNHFTWFTKIEDSAGVDLYPRLRELARVDPAAYIDNHRLLTGELMALTGVQCVTDDSHSGEYLRWGAYPRSRLAPGMAPNPFYRRYREAVEGIEARVRRVLAGDEPLSAILDYVSGEEVIPIVERALHGETWQSDAINVRNEGPFIPDLPSWAVVEVPGTVDAAGGHGKAVAGLPNWILALCATQVHIHKLTVQAAMNGDRQAAIEALLIDPSVPDPQLATDVFDALLEAHREWLPNFG